MPTQIVFNLDGTGTCQLSGQYAESYPGNTMTQPISMGSANVVFSQPTTYCTGPTGFGCESFMTQAECELPQHEGCYWDDGSVQCNTDADTNCDNCVSFTELMNYANRWINKQGPSFDDIMQAANGWAGRNKAVC